MSPEQWGMGGGCKWLAVTREVQLRSGSTNAVCPELQLSGKWAILLEKSPHSGHSISLPQQAVLLMHGTLLHWAELFPIICHWTPCWLVCWAGISRLVRCRRVSPMLSASTHYWQHQYTPRFSGGQENRSEKEWILKQSLEGCQSTLVSGADSHR